MYQSQSSIKPSAGSPVILGASPLEQNLLGMKLTGTQKISRLG